MEDKQTEKTASGAISSEEYEARYSEYMEKLAAAEEEEEEKEKLDFIDSTIINSLNENNIFSAVMTVDEIRNKLIEIVQQIEYEDLSKKGWDGYWQSSDGKLVLNEKYQDGLITTSARETAIHELLHALSTTTIYNTETNEYEFLCGVKKNLGVGKEYGRGFTEGITEYLAQKLCHESEYIYNSGIASFNISGTYAMEQIAIKQLAILYGEDKIIDAYLNNHNIDMPQEQYLELRTNFDYINEKDSRIRDIYKGRAYEELSETEQSEIAIIQNNIENTFIDSQQYFLEKCLLEEINSIANLEQAEAMKAKLKELNSLQIKVENNEKANYQKYNFAFIRKYLQIINQDKNYDEQVKFEDVEKYLIGEDTSLIAINNKLLATIEKLKETENHRFLNNIGAFFVECSQEIVEDLKDMPIISSIINGTIEGTKKVKNFFQTRKKEQFIAINRGQEGKIYIKEVGEDIIAGNKISSYEYLTEEQYEQYIAGNKDIKGDILRGNIDFNKLKKNKEYEYYVGHHLLAQDRIEEKLLNYNGYVGSIGEDNRENVIPQVQERFEENEKYIKIKPDGYEQDIYITEVQNKDSKELKRYILLTKEEIESRKRYGNSFVPPISIQGNIDLEKITIDKRYKEALEKEMLTKERVEEKCENFQGYVGEIATNGYEYYKCNSVKYLEQFANRGANGEEKRAFGYFIPVAKTGEIDPWGKEIYEYEVITSEEMQKMWSDPTYVNNSDREKIIVIGSEIDINYRFRNFDDIVFSGGYIGYDERLIEKYENKQFVLEDLGIILWQMGNNAYISSLIGKEFDSRNKIHGNLDIERMNKDQEYKKFIVENILTRGCVEDILAKEIDSIKVMDEKDGEFSWSIGKKKETERNEPSRNTQGIER